MAAHIVYFLAYRSTAHGHKVIALPKAHHRHLFFLKESKDSLTMKSPHSSPQSHIAFVSSPLFIQYLIQQYETTTTRNVNFSLGECARHVQKFVHFPSSDLW